MKQGLDYLNNSSDVVAEAFRSFGPRLRELHGNIAHEFKDPTNVVTDMDRWVEIETKKAISAFDSSVGFLGEEHGAEGDQNFRWLIDPIDGTEHFVRGIPMCVNMATLVDGSDVLMSVIYNFATDELFWAGKGMGAWCNGDRLSVSDRQLKGSMIDMASVGNIAVAETVRSLHDSGTYIMRFFGSGITTVMIASGKIDGRIVVGGKGGIWDYAPVGVFIPEAGGVVTKLNGEEYNYNDLSFVASNKQLSKDLLELLS